MSFFVCGGSHSSTESGRLLRWRPAGYPDWFFLHLPRAAYLVLRLSLRYPREIGVRNFPWEECALCDTKSFFAQVEESRWNR